MSELTAPTQSEVPEALRVGRAAFARHAWREAFEQLSQADAATTLGARPRIACGRGILRRARRPPRGDRPAIVRGLPERR